jgi:hypothetical protein
VATWRTETPTEGSLIMHRLLLLVPVIALLMSLGYAFGGVCAGRSYLGFPTLPGCTQSGRR